MQLMVFIALKTYLCKITFIYIVTKSIKYCIVRKVAEYINNFWTKKVISENAIGSYSIVKILYI